MLGYAVVGVKGEGKRHLEAAALNPNVTIAAVVDADAAAAKEYAARYDVPWFTNHHDLIDAGVAQIATVAVPHHLLAPIGTDLLEGGLHTLLEKPVAPRVSTIDDLMATATREGRHLGVRLQYRQFRTNEVVHELVHGGSVGRLKHVLWVDHLYRSIDYYRRAGWRQQWSTTGGGNLIGHHVHDVDLLNWTVNALPRQVSALATRSLHDVPFEDMTSASLLYDDGLVATWQASYLGTVDLAVRHLAGESGVIVVDRFTKSSVDVPARVRVGHYDRSLVDHLDDPYDPDGGPDVSWSEELEAEHRTLRKRIRNRLITPPRRWNRWFDEFVAAVRDGREPSPSMREARNAVEIVDAMILSTVTQRVVELPIDSDEYDAVHGRLCSGELTLPGSPSFGPG